MGQVALSGVPRHVPPEEEGVGAATLERAQQTAVVRRVAVAPRGGDGEPEEDELHGTSSRVWSTCSTCSARWAYVCSRSTRSRAAAPIVRARAGVRFRT